MLCVYLAVFVGVFLVAVKREVYITLRPETVLVWLAHRSPINIWFWVDLLARFTSCRLHRPDGGNRRYRLRALGLARGSLVCHWGHGDIDDVRLEALMNCPLGP